MFSARVKLCCRLVQFLEHRPCLSRARGVSQSSVLLKKKSPKDDRRVETLQSSDSKDKLLDAAADVATSMTGIEEAVFKDLEGQISKFDTGASPGPLPPSISRNKEKRMPLIKGERMEHTVKTKKRIDKILQQYASDSNNKLRAPSADPNASPGTATTAAAAAAPNASPGTAAVGSPTEDTAAEVTPKKKFNSTMEDVLDDPLKSTPSSSSFLDELIAAELSHNVPPIKDSQSGKGEHVEVEKPVKSDLDLKAAKPQQKAESSSPQSWKGKVEKFIKDKSDTSYTGNSIALSMVPRTPKHQHDGRLFGKGLLDDAKPLAIFNPAKWKESNLGEPIPMLDSWTEQFNRQLRESQFFAKNGFEEMIRWTEEGKLWKFPIDNEQGMEEEQQVPFYEHVFLEKHLQPFPSSGPIRTFMELVTLGLSKNPHLTVKEKMEHIQWFENYFREKQSIVSHEALLAEAESAADV